MAPLENLNSFIQQLREMGWLSDPKQHTRCNVLSPHINLIENMNTIMLSLPHIIKSIHHEAQYVFIMSPVGKMVQARSHLSEPARPVVLSTS